MTIIVHDFTSKNILLYFKNTFGKDIIYYTRKISFSLLLLLLWFLFDFVHALPVGDEALTEFARVAAKGDRRSWFKAVVELSLLLLGSWTVKFSVP